jgi:hypothetical protein
MELRFPAGPSASVDEVLASVRSEPAGGRLVVGDPRIGDFLAAFARRLLAPSLARRFPELGSLGFFLRRNEIVRAVARMQAAPDGAPGGGPEGQGAGNVYVFPRGLVFHVPPANVDTIFVYSWALSALAGNANVVRISARSTGGAASAVLDALNETLGDADPVVAQTQRMVTYGHDDAVTAALSAACDLRVIWGGDRAVTEIRRHPLSPAARDLTFPDRASFAALSVAGWQRSSTSERRTAVEAFANDAYWFDQAACASPRALFLVGSTVDAEPVREEFLSGVAAVVQERSWGVDAAMAVEKRVSTYGVAAEGAASRIAFTGNAVATLDLVSPADVPRRWLGAGTFPIAVIPSLVDLVPIVTRKDQTFSHFGFAREELAEFALALGGRGIDRIVPFGSALTFSASWDGYDLTREFTRLTTLS